MSDSYVQKKIGNGIIFSGVYDKKFKTNMITARFITKLDYKDAPVNTLLLALLSTSNKVIKLRTELNKKLLSLYDSGMKSFSYAIGDYQVVGMTIRFIGDNYTLNNERISTEITNVLLDCILNPNIENGKFDENDFLQRKNELIDAIKSEINDRRGYAAMRANTFIYVDEPASIYENGTVVQAEKISQDDLIKAYNKLMNESFIDISVIGGGNTEKAEKMIFDAFGKMDRNKDFEIEYDCPSVIKSETAEISEQYDVNQCKMFMAFKTDSDDFYAHKLMSAMFGGTPFSFLFANVREKMSLCYYCSAGITECKSTMIVDSGIERANVDKAKSEILKQFDLISKGDFTDEHLENTKKALCNGFLSNIDGVSALNSWYFVQRVRGNVRSPEEVCKIIMNIPRERVINSAKSFKLDTVYLMEPEVK